MPKAKVRQARSETSKGARKPTPLETRLAALEARIAEWGAKLDTQFVQLNARMEALEKRAPVPGPKGEKGDPGPQGPKGGRAMLDRLVHPAPRVSVASQVQRDH